VHILVVEDDRRMSALLQQALTEECHTGANAMDGRVALAMATASIFDLILLRLAAIPSPNLQTAPL